jgi:hypothetical protein
MSTIFEPLLLRNGLQGKYCTQMFGLRASLPWSPTMLGINPTVTVPWIDVPDRVVEECRVTGSEVQVSGLVASQAGVGA